MTATTEATGAPQATPAPPQERVVIDATDEIELSDVEALQEPPVAEAISDTAVIDPPAEEPVADEAPDSEAAIADEAAELKPRTRFNPWS